MKQPTHSENNPTLLHPPAYPFTGPGLFRELRRQLSPPGGALISYRMLGHLVGKSRSTTHHWFESYPGPQLISFMCLLERLSPEQRGAYIEAHCRMFPNLDHPYLCHDRPTLRHLESSLNQKAGLTFLTGGTDLMRTFVLTAMGHTFWAAQRHNPPAGIDLHVPDTFVPVVSLKYIDPKIGGRRMGTLIQGLWPRIATSASTLVLFNGVWSVSPRFQPNIRRLACHKHVIVAEERAPQIDRLRAGGDPKIDRLEINSFALPKLRVKASEQ